MVGVVEGSSDGSGAVVRGVDPRLGGVKSDGRSSSVGRIRFLRS